MCYDCFGPGLRSVLFVRMVDSHLDGMMSTSRGRARHSRTRPSRLNAHSRKGFWPRPSQKLVTPFSKRAKFIVGTFDRISNSQSKESNNPKSDGRTTSKERNSEQQTALQLLVLQYD